MKRHSRLLIAGAALILAGNAVALIGVAYNRSGEPEAVLELSERELAWPHDSRAASENSARTLQLRWRIGGDAQAADTGITYGGGTAPWLDQEKLSELGFNVGVPRQGGDAARHLQGSLPREAHVVLEFNGPDYQLVVQQRKRLVDEALALLDENPGQRVFVERVKTYQAQLDRELHDHSRLFAIDVGLDVATLRRRYPDRSAYLILPAQIGLVFRNNGLGGYISSLSVTAVNLPWHERLTIAEGISARPKHYSVRLAIGKRAEPWILEARRTMPRHAGED